MAWTEYELLTNGTSVLQLFQYSNNVTDGVFGYSIAVSIWIMMFSMIYKRERMEDAVVFASFFSMILNIFLFTVGIVNDNVVVISILLTGISAVLSNTRKPEYTS